MFSCMLKWLRTRVVIHTAIRTFTSVDIRDLGNSLAYACTIRQATAARQFVSVLAVLLYEYSGQYLP